MTTAVADDLEALERQGWEALSGPDGARFYEELMADDGVMVFPGMLLDKAQTLEAIRATDPWTTFELSDLRVIQGTADSAMVVYHAVARREGEPPYRARMSTAYVRRRGRWRLVLHQQTPEPAAR